MELGLPYIEGYKPRSNYQGILADAVETIGNEIDRVVHWKSGSDVSQFVGKPVRLRFVFKDADLFAIQFQDKQ